MDRPWQLDPLPLCSPAAEWRALEAGVAQRADAARPRCSPTSTARSACCATALLPPELVFAHPGFLRPCHGIAVAGRRCLHLYAADLARSPDGRWWVLADRTQAPSGAGYALENR